MPKVKLDDEMKTFAADVLESIAQAKRGEFARVHTPADIATYKARGRPVGSVKPRLSISPKTAIVSQSMTPGIRPDF